MAEVVCVCAEKPCWHDIDAMRAENASLHALVRELSLREESWHKNQWGVVSAERDRLREALEAAASSLESIAKQAGRDRYMEDVVDVRAYASSRADVARRALEAVGK